MTRYTDLMVDLETLGKKPGCCLLEIGLCAFSLGGDPSDMVTGSIFPDVVEQMSLGGEVEVDTLRWWATKPEALDIQWNALRIPVADAQDMLTQFFGEYCDPQARVWAKGTHFDLPLLTHWYTEPWHFRNIHELRTVLMLSGNDSKIAQTGTAHSGMDDAHSQALWLVHHLTPPVDLG